MLGTTWRRDRSTRKIERAIRLSCGPRSMCTNASGSIRSISIQKRRSFASSSASVSSSVTNGASTLSRSPRYTGYVVTDGTWPYMTCRNDERVVEVRRRLQLQVLRPWRSAIS